MNFAYLGKQTLLAEIFFWNQKQFKILESFRLNENFYKFIQ